LTKKRASVRKRLICSLREEMADDRQIGKR